MIYQNTEWTFKGKHSWNKYNNKINLFINDRILKNNQKINNGINEVRKIFLINWNIINDNIKNKKPIIINKKEYYLKDNLSKYLQDNIIIDIINKNII